jgi:predicted transcriptional regulator
MKAMQQSKMRCLKIDDKWVNLILNGRKTWEIRRTNTTIREQIALGNKEKKRVVGYAKIVDSMERTVEDLKKHNDKHQANDFIDMYANGKETLFAWVLEEIEVEPNPRPYSYSTGSWCKALT